MTTENPSAGTPAPVTTPASAPAQPPVNEQTKPTPAPSAADPAIQQPTPEPGEPQADNAEEGQGEDIRQKKRSARQRIAELTAQKYALQREIADQRAEIARLRQPLEVPKDRELSLDEQDAYRLRQVVREERADEMEAEARRRAEALASAQAEMFEKRVEDVADRIPDIREKVFDRTLPISTTAAEFIAESDRGAEVAYWLATNRNEAARIAGLSPTRQAAELARIEARLQAAPQVRKVSQAPPPVQTVGGGTQPSPKDPANMSDAEYSAWYAERQKARRR